MRDSLGARTTMRSVAGLTSILIALLALPSLAQSRGQPYIHSNLPHWADSVLRQAGLGTQFLVFHDLNPYYQRGDFDGDGKIDLAIQVITITSKKRGIAIIHSANLSVHLVGAGHPLGNGGDDFSWLWVWRVEPYRDSGRGLARESLYVEKPESASGWIVWNGREYTWIQGSD